MYGQYTVEVDGLYGPYEECNPVTVGGKPGSNPFSGGGSGWADTQNFQCGENCLMPTRAENCTSTGHSSWDKPHNGSVWTRCGRLSPFAFFIVNLLSTAFCMGT
jgi:hypothetical protein